jgi:hypothetical protein
VKLAPTLVVAAVALWTAPAWAQNGYPPIIDSTLGVQIESFLPQHGCQLCHTDPNGGTASLRPFGELMVSRYGLISTMTETPAADESVATACTQLETGDPKLVEDLRMGMDPNVDASEPVPAYGCSNSIAPGGATPSGALLAIGGAIALAMLRRVLLIHTLGRRPGKP